jgi:hypothetical protein
VVLDTTTLRCLKIYSTEFEFNVLRGYLWKEVSEPCHARIRHFIAREYEDKKNAVTEEERNLAKLKLNSIYGYTLKRGMNKFKRGKKGTWNVQLARNAPILESIDEKDHSFMVRNTYDL